MKIKNVFTSGKMNKDADERLIPQGEYRDALNVKVANSEGSDVGSIENALSNAVKSSLDFGSNAECIGSVSSDGLKKIYWFVVSDNGSYIVEYNEETEASEIIISGSALNFSSDYRIHSSDIVIDSDNDKVFLYWTDNNNPPRRIEISEAKLWTTFTDADISIIKAAPKNEPTFTGYNSAQYADNNNIEDKMFSFAYRYQYTHGEWSALSPFSEPAFLAGTIDTDFSDSENQGMANTWNNIQVFYNNGGPEVKKVEVYAVENGKNTAYRIHTDKKLGADNLTDSFYFRNDKTYPVLASNEFNKVYDNVPLKASTQAMIGNRLVYGGYEENYDIDTTLNYSLAQTPGNTITGGQAEKTLKAGHTYEVGFVYFDDYGRKSTVLSNYVENTISFSANDTSTRLRVNIEHLAPSWAKRYKFAVKSNVGLYETIRTEGPAYKKDGVMYVKMYQEDYNKLSTERNVVLKNNGKGRMATKYIFDFVEIYTAEADELYSGSEAGAYAKLESSFDVNTVFDWVSGALVDPNQVDVDTDTALVFESVEKSAPESVYYEVPGTYDIIDRYHQGDSQNQNATDDGIVILEAYNAWAFGDGTESAKALDLQTNLQIYMGVRVNEEIDDYGKTVRPSSITYSEVYEQSTGYNGLSSFNLNLLNYKDLDDKYGRITKLVSKDTDLISFQEDKVHRILVNKNVLFTASGTGDVSQSLNVLGQEVAYLGEYGINNSPDSVQLWRNSIYFVDNRRGVVCDLDANGIFEISQYGMKRWFNDNLSLESGNKAIAGYDPYNDHYIASIGDQYTVAFSTDAKGWASFYSYIPESMTSVGNNFYTFKDGQLYKHNIKTGQRNVFYGQSPANTEVEFVMNASPSEVKIFKAVELEGNSGNWDASIVTNLDEGHINKLSFKDKEDKYWAYIRRNLDDILNTRLLSVQGIGNLTSIDGNTATFINVPSSARVGDSLYFFDGVDNLLMGSVTDKTSTTLVVDTVNNTPSVSDFCFVAKNPEAESYGLKGYHANVRLTNNTTEPLELFAVNSEVVKSFM
jgi:hypothetical protein